jgi:hypothetical protein
MFKTEFNLFMSVDKTYKAAIAYWKKNRGEGAKAMDISTFFRSKRGTDNEFKSFWRGKNNKYRAGFYAAWKKVEVAISND